MPLNKLRKWTESENEQLLILVNEYLAKGNSPDYRNIAKRIIHRSAKQCRERYENSLQPDVKRGEWSFDETLNLARLMSVYGQNWAAVKDQLKTRTYNAIKKKGRKLLGEIVDRHSIPEGTTSKARSNWVSEETNRLLQIHHELVTPGDKQNDYLFLALQLKSGRSEAEVERQLIQKCLCHSCRSLNSEVMAFHCSVEHLPDIAGFKERWSVWKSNQVAEELAFRGPKNLRYKSRSRTSSRRESTISNSSDVTMISTSSKRIKLERTEEDCYSQGPGSPMSIKEVFFPFPECSEQTPTAHVGFELNLESPTTELAMSLLTLPDLREDPMFAWPSLGDEMLDLNFL